MTAKPESLLKQGKYSLEWIKDFYDQAGVWWGADPQASGVHAQRVETVARLCGSGIKDILELGAGPGATAAAMADAGHQVVSVELSSTRAEYARQLAKVPRPGSMEVLEADFYTVELGRKFDVICCWETFGLGSDADQRRLLRRMAEDWLLDDGSVLMDVYSPVLPIRQAGSERRLSALKGVPGSVEMVNRCHFDANSSRWIDEWIPVDSPADALAQSIRCYLPADFLLLLEGCGLQVKHAEVEGQAFDLASEAVLPGGLLMDAWCYLVQLGRSG